MNRTLTFLAAATFAVFSLHAGDAEFSGFRYQGTDPRPAGINPILSGFYPDPSVCRRGDTYYLVNSSFSYYPGVPLFQSKDLVNWVPLGHVLNRPSQLNLTNQEVSCGIFAPAISYNPHNRLFYLVTTSVCGIGNFYVTTADPAKGWSDPVRLPEIHGIDPSFFFDDDGSAFLVHNADPDGGALYPGQRAIRLYAFDPVAGRVTDGGIELTRGSNPAEKPIWPEGPHLFKANGWYYLMCAEGGTGPGHTEVIFRSKSPRGPYVPNPANPILTQRDLPPDRPRPVTCAGHADFVQTPAGAWYAVFLGCRPYEDGLGNLGRETFLLPVTWKNGWPQILPPKTPVPDTFPVPGLGAPGPLPLHGSFCLDKPFTVPLSPEWSFLRTPTERFWSVADGRLTLRPRAATIRDRANPSALFRRQQHDDFTAEVTLRYAPEREGDFAGLVLFQNERFNFTFGLTLRAGAPTLQVTRDEQGKTELLASEALPAGLAGQPLRLAAEARGRWYSFRYRVDGQTWCTLVPRADGANLSTERAGGFVGATLGLYATTRNPVLGQSASTAAATNPIIWADVPDISIVRVGCDYYMSSTTMHLAPGVPIMHSRDLVNWQIIDYAYQTLANTDALALRHGKNAYGNGSWASSLRYHAGEFIVTTFAHDTGRTHVYRKPILGRGEWRADSFAPACHDHTLFFDDDGRTYLIFGGGRLELMELKPDASGPLPGGLRRTLIENATAPATAEKKGLPAEGSQLFKVNGFYYLFNICWPPNKCRTVLCHRASKITGPWEGRVVLQNQGVAQGGLVDTPDGRWFAYLFQDDGAVGRTPWLVPVEWKDGWPVFGLDGHAPLTVTLPAATGLIPGLVAADEFNRRPGERPLPLVWQWNHNPVAAGWSLAERPGWLRLKAFERVPELAAARDQLGQRTFGPACTAETYLDASALREGDFAGLTLFQKRYGFIGVTVTNGMRRLVVVQAHENQPAEIASAPLAAAGVYLRAQADYRNRADRGTFAYSPDGKTWTPLGAPLQMVYTLPHFMGYRFGLFCFATGTPAGYADFDFFHVR